MCSLQDHYHPTPQRKVCCPACIYIVFISNLLSWNWTVHVSRRRTRKYAFQLCGHLDIESAVATWIGDYKPGSCDSPSSLSWGLCQETQYLASIIPDKLLQYICCNLNCAQTRPSLHSRWNFSSTFTELHDHGDRTLPNGSDVRYMFSHGHVRTNASLVAQLWSCRRCFNRTKRHLSHRQRVSRWAVWGERTSPPPPCTDCSRDRKCCTAECGTSDKR